MAVLDAEATIAVQLEALARQQVDEPWELIVAEMAAPIGRWSLSRPSETGSSDFGSSRHADGAARRTP